MAGTAELKARLPYAVQVRTWSRGRVDERSVIDEPECCIVLQSHSGSKGTTLEKYYYAFNYCRLCGLS